MIDIEGDLTAPEADLFAIRGRHILFAQLSFPARFGAWRRRSISPGRPVSAIDKEGGRVQRANGFYHPAAGARTR